MYRILIIGANRGIGHELATRFSLRGHTVYGTYRPQSRNDETVRKMIESTTVTALELDFTEEESIIRAASTFPSDSLDVLINCAGVYYMWDDKPFTELTAEHFLDHFKVNTLGPFLASKHFLPLLSKSPSVGKIINVSSDFASISDNTGGNACYRVSKAALNQLTKTMAIDLAKTAPNVLTLSVHPGYVATKMTGYFGEDDMEQCMSGLVKVVEDFGTESASPSLSSGGYVKWNGEKMNF
ncbi:NAD(P)-binding protein [Agrocybe pediades]|nr:NAD(P)-binding protein [Agrocybe pediades]